MRPSRPLPAVLALCGVVSGGCAQISTETRSVVHVAPDARPLFSATTQAHAQLEVRWSQRGHAVELELLERRTCRTTALVPARRDDLIVRRPDAMIYWEYGIAALALGLSVASFVRPESFSTVRYDSDLGLYERDRKTGYRLGGVFAAIGTGFLIGGIVDAVRSRDLSRSVDTTATQVGPATPCAAPTVPASQRALELAVGPLVLTGASDDEGKARFTLPPELAAEPAAPLPVTLLVGPDALVLPLLTPGARPDAPSHEGALQGPPR